MVQIFDLPQRQDFGSSLGQALGQGFNQGFTGGFENQRQFNQNQTLNKQQFQQKKALEQQKTQQARAQQQQQQQQDLGYLNKILQEGNQKDPQSMLNAVLSAPISNESKKLALDVLGTRQEQMRKDTERYEQERYLSNLFGINQNPQNTRQNVSQMPPENGQQEISEDQGLRQYNPEKIPDSNIAALAVKNPKLAQIVQAQKQQNQQANLKERDFETSYSKESVKEADALRASLPKKEMALDLARDAVQNGNVEYFSKDKLADITGVDLFRTAKGAQLITASKENLISNLANVSARAQNLWMEQRMNSMFPKIGQTKEANLTTQELIEAEVAMDRAYLREFDRLKKEDNDAYGFERKDISQRAHSNIEPRQNEIMKRTSVRLREIQENEMGLSKLKAEVGKNAVKGTPLTFAMGKLYHQKYGDKALEKAKSNGYFIPTIEEYRTFQATPREFREGL